MKKYTGLTAFIVSSYWQVFRINFVVFSLYLMGHAFYIWDGFREYGSFTDFLLSISLASILWTIIAAVTALLLWLPALLRATMWPFRRVDLKIKIGELLLFAGIFILIGLFTWKFKKLIWPDVTTSVHIKLIVFMCLAVVSGFITRLLHSNTVERCVDVIQERIAPLVWLFGVYLVLSVPSIAYYTWFNIILVTFDALTARDMSLYGYRRETTPFISKWAKNASIFTMAEASSDYTRPTTASLMTGKRVWTHQLYRAHGVINGAKENLPLLLKNSGYYNIALVQNHLASVETFGISKSFDTAPNASYFMEPLSLDGTIDKHLFKLFGSKFRIYNIFESQGFITKKILSLTRREVSMTEYPPGIIFSKLLEIVNDNSIEPFFAWLHILPPHDPYIAPEPYMGMFDPSQRLRTNDLSAGKLSDERICNEEDREIYRARYDEFIRYCDKKFEDFVSQVSKTNRLKNTVVILSADHGESFEHGSAGRYTSYDS
ncbi:MAG: sulfatase-like hydrolase/transferase [Nitrospirae bacterium]|nr:sulfatase-like hydrolase/transferase [Nitrospirota bacterium]